MTLSRRTLFTAGVTTGLAAATAVPATAAPHVSAVDLLATADDGKLALVDDVRAKRISTIGVEVLLDDRDGRVVGVTPSNLDGTGAFVRGGEVRIIRNHECRANASVPVPLVEGTVYDAGVSTGVGGNTVIATDRQGGFRQQWVGLSGTIRNCTGGGTPWGSWLSCEEDTTRAGTEVTSSVDGRTYVTQKDHGYVFEVFPGPVSEQIPEPITAWGRAVWEGAAIDPNRRVAYITEDTGCGLFYRWLAPAGRTIGAGIARDFGPADGTLQAAQLVRDGQPLVHFGELSEADLDQPYPVTWIDGGADRQAQETPLRDQFPGPTTHPKIEGCWPDEDGLWFTLSYVSRGEMEKYGLDGQDSGMIMHYSFADSTMTLKDCYPAGNRLGARVPGDPTEAIKQFHGPDNICVSPWGSVVIAEDGDNPCSLLACKESTRSVEFVRDLADRGEWADPCFGGKGLLIASVQSDCTYAFTGALGRVLGGR